MHIKKNSSGYSWGVMEKDVLDPSRKFMLLVALCAFGNCLFAFSLSLFENNLTLSFLEIN